MGGYPTEGAEWRGFDSKPLQTRIDAWPAPVLAPTYAGEADIESYTIDYSGPEPRPVVLARTAAAERVVAAVDDPALVLRFIEEEPLGGKVTVAGGGEGRSVITAFEPAG